MSDQEVTDTKIRGIPVEVYELYKERARRNYRSLNAQLIYDMQDLAHREYVKQQGEGAE